MKSNINMGAKWGMWAIRVVINTTTHLPDEILLALYDEYPTRPQQSLVYNQFHFLITKNRMEIMPRFKKAKQKFTFDQ